jgi:hypothetical protein
MSIKYDLYITSPFFSSISLSRMRENLCSSSSSPRYGHFCFHDEHKYLFLIKKVRDEGGEEAPVRTERELI